MSDIFISYASEDRDQAHKLASVLETLGWSVWWDRHIITGQAYDQVIERELNRARSVVVLWSSHSVASEWVKNEAAAAAERGVLLPVLIERVTVPLEFRRRQTADLFGWDGDPSHNGFQALCRGCVGYDRRGCTKSADDRAKIGLAPEPALGISCGRHDFGRIVGRILRRSMA